MNLRIIQIALFFLVFLCCGITGIQSQALDVVNSSGDTLLHVQNDGNVGIGTTSPGYPLQVGNHAYLTNDTVNEFAVLGSTTSGGGDKRLHLEADWTRIGGDFFNPAVEIRSGNVGIGTTNPLYRLDVRSANDNIALFKALGGNTGELYIASTNVPGAKSINIASNEGYDSGLSFTTRDVSGTGVRMVITDVGNVGIGTTSPSAKLDIKAGNTSDVLLHLAKYGNDSKQLVIGNTNQPSHEWFFRVDNTSHFSLNKDGVSTPYIFIDTNSGNVGIGTTSPVSKLHVSGGDINLDLGKALRIGNELVLWRDSGGVTVGSNLVVPLKLLAGNEHVRITTSGNVGIGTTSPISTLEVYPPSSGDYSIRGLSGTGGTKVAVFGNAPNGKGVHGDTFNGIGVYGYASTGTAGQFFSNTGYGLIVEKGNVGIGTTIPSFPLEMASGARVTVGGVWTNASSREYKENIRDLTVQEAMTALRELQPTRFNYKVDKEEEHVGFIAEDVPDLVATPDRKGLSPMDIVAVLTKVVQEQQKKIEALEARLNATQ